MVVAFFIETHNEDSVIIRVKYIRKELNEP